MHTSVMSERRRSKRRRLSHRAPFRARGPWGTLPCSPC